VEKFNSDGAVELSKTLRTKKGIRTPETVCDQDYLKACKKNELNK
jgi:hypothetical protein